MGTGAMFRCAFFGPVIASEARGGGSFSMLRKSNDRIRLCYQKAAEARERALRETDPELREGFFREEDRWIGLAHSFELSESLSDFATEIRRGIENRKKRALRRHMTRASKSGQRERKH